MEKDLGITEAQGPRANIPDIQVYRAEDAFTLLCKASSKEPEVFYVDSKCIKLY